MKAISLEYHDVVDDYAYDSSGFPGCDAARYKLDLGDFRRHMMAIAAVIKSKPIKAAECHGLAHPNSSVILTFDDGGSSAYHYIADILEKHGWSGHFFVTTDYIGRPAFLSKEQIRALRKRGHVIGTHSCSHPERMSHLSWDQLIGEWRASVKVLSDILGEPTTIGSVPGGYYSRKVSEAAAASGLKVLFTSEPTTWCHQVNGCLVLGRYTVVRGTAPQVSAGLASGELVPRMRQSLLWNAKKVAKVFGGRFYSKIRKFIIERAN